MNAMKKHKNLTGAVLVACLLALGVFLTMPRAVAQSEAGQDLSHQTWSTAFTGGAAAVNTATGRSIVLHSLVVRASAAGVLILKDGSNSGTTLLNLYLAQDTTVTITPDMLAGSVRTTNGNCLFIAADTDTMTGWAIYSKQL